MVYKISTPKPFKQVKIKRRTLADATSLWNIICRLIQLINIGYCTHTVLILTNSRMPKCDSSRP